MSMATINGYEVIQGTSGTPKDPRHNIRLRQESDPNNLDPHEPGAKLDEGKNRLGLVLGDFARALEQVGHVGSFGLKKYSASGWVSAPDGVCRYTDALYRHLNSEAQGQERDKDSGLLHAAHAAWNALARLDLMLRMGDEKK